MKIWVLATNDCVDNPVEVAYFSTEALARDAMALFPSSCEHVVYGVELDQWANKGKLLFTYGFSDGENKRPYVFQCSPVEKRACEVWAKDEAEAIAILVERGVWTEAQARQYTDYENLFRGKAK